MAALIAGLSLPALAQDSPPLPLQRPDFSPAVETAEEPAAPEASAPVVALPRQRPEAVEPAPAVEAAPEPAPPVAIEPVPAAPPAEMSPPRIYQTACPAVVQGRVAAEALPPIKEGVACGTQSPLALTGVFANGRMVPITGGVVTDCSMATALPDWVAAVDGYLGARENTGLAEVIGGTSYMCRNVNNGVGGNLSFHAFADALDVVGFKLEDGRTINVESGWGDALSAEGRLLRFAHDSACSLFTTTLGPEANAQHHDHLHIDMGCHGKTCTARLCE